MELILNNVEVNIAAEKIINGVNMHIKNNEFVALLGPNGSGKSTLLKTIYRVLRPASGTIFLNDLDIQKMSNRAIAQKMSVVSQFQTNSFDFTVKEAVLIGRNPHLKMLEREKQSDHHIVEDALRKTGLEQYQDRWVSNLSGGERQRVALARAITQNPSIMILDEPSNHLDIKYQIEILHIIKQLNLTVLAALHDIPLAAQFCDYIYFIKDGVVVYEGRPKEVITKEVIKEVYEIDCEVFEEPNTKKICVSYYTPNQLGETR